MRPAASRQPFERALEAELADFARPEEAGDGGGLGGRRRDVEGEGVELADQPRLDDAGEVGVVGGVGDELGHRPSFGPAARAAAQVP